MATLHEAVAIHSVVIAAARNKIAIRVELRLQGRIVKVGEKAGIYGLWLRDVVDRLEVVVAQAEVQGQFPGHLPVVLDVRLKVVAPPVAPGVAADGHTVDRMRPLLVLPDPAQVHICQRIARGDSTRVAEGQETLGVEAELFILAVVLEEEAHFQAVLAPCVDDVVLHRDDGVGVRPR